MVALIVAELVYNAILNVLPVEAVKLWVPVINSLLNDVQSAWVIAIIVSLSVQLIVDALL